MRGLLCCLFWETKTTCHTETFQKQGEDYRTLLHCCLLITHPASFSRKYKKVKSEYTVQ